MGQVSTVITTPHRRINALLSVEYVTCLKTFGHGIVTDGSGPQTDDEGLNPQNQERLISLVLSE